MPEPPFKNWSEKKLDGSKAELIEKMREARKKIRFKPILELPPWIKEILRANRNAR